MRKFISAFLIIFLGLSSLATAAEEGSNALLIKMQRQLQVGSGLTGSFVIHGSTDSEKYPLVSSLLDSEFQFRSIRSGDQLHAVIFQPGNNDTMAAKNEVYQEGKKTYFRMELYCKNQKSIIDNFQKRYYNVDKKRDRGCIYGSNKSE